MKHLQIELTSRCNLQCVECPHRLMKRKKESMTAEVLRTAITKIVVPQELDTVILHKDGEPLLYPGLKAAIHDICYTHKGKIDIYTNGIMFSKAFYDFLGGIPGTRFCLLVSFHFYNFDGSRNDYLLTTQELQSCLKEPYPNIEIILTTHKTIFTDEKMLKTWQKMWLSKGVQAVHINENINKWAGKVEDGNTGFVACPYADGAHLFVGVTGNVLPCCIDLEEELILGNIMTDSLEDLLERQREFYENLNNPELRKDTCRRCLCG